MRILTIALLMGWASVTLGQVVSAQEIRKGMVQVREGRRLYVEYQKAEPGKPTLFLANGLTYSTREWAPFVRALKEAYPGLGLVLWDMRGMGRTLLEEAPVDFEIPMAEQTEDLRALKQKLGISGPVSLAGLSYGGALTLDYASKYGDDFDHFIAIAPFLERLKKQDEFINFNIRNHRLMVPLDPRTDEELYDFYLRHLVYTTYPLAEPILLENPWKLEGAYRMVKGAKNFLAMALGKLFPKKKIHTVAAENDEHVLLERMNLFWESVPDAARASYLIMAGTRHKIPEDRPKFLATWVRYILDGHPDLQKGLTFEGDPYKGEARSGKTVLPVHKVGRCETLLRVVLPTR